MAFHLHRAERTDLLAQGLGELLATPPADPFGTDLVLVPARGVERWLSQRLSHLLGAEHNDGVCAGVRFRSPRSLIAELTGDADADPWDPDALTWPLLAVIDDAVTQPWCAPLAAHLGAGTTGAGTDGAGTNSAGPNSDEAELRRGRRYAVARRIAGLFASYGRQRPQLLTDWAAGRDTDGAGRALAADLAWQPRLWRGLVERVPADPPDVRHRRTVARLAAGGLELPERLSLFGHTRLSATDIELLAAVAAGHDLHLWLPHPSDALWRALAGRHGPVRRREDPDHRAAGHPLLASLGRDLRELQRALPADGLHDEHLPDTRHREDLLGWLQSDLAANALRPDGRKPAAGDRSVQVHSCHGPARQIEVLRETVLGLLADDDTLEPRDILVMCPDIERYAPLVLAAFGLGDLTGHRPDGAEATHPAYRLRVQLADRSLSQTNPLLGVAEQLLAMAEGRGTATELLDVAQAAPVRARFGFTDDDIETLTEWVRESGIRWGIDAEHRRPYGLDGVVHNTWRFGLDRILAGVAMSQDAEAWIGTALPLDDVGSNQVDLAGRFAEFADRLADVLDRLSGAHPLTHWVQTLRDGVDGLARATGEDAWQRNQLDRELAEVTESAARHRDTLLRLNDIRSLLGDHLVGRPSRANFRTGAITVCTMTPMRSVPHRVVCLVGLDDGVFPRSHAVDGDDVLARDPLAGERDRRAEDRQLLLDAIGAATETLVITYTGRDDVSGQLRPPAVPLAELLDTLDRTAAQPVRTQILIQHPLLSFDAENVTPGSKLAAPGTPFSFDPTALAGARAMAAGPRGPAPVFLSGPLPVPPPGDVALDELVNFFRDPIRGFFRALDVALPWQADDVEDAMAVEVGGLTGWAVGTRMLAELVRGTDRNGVLQAEWRRGTLPPGRLGWRTANSIVDKAAAVAEEARSHLGADPRAVDVDIELAGGRRILGTVGAVHGTQLVSYSYSSLGPKQLMETWIPLLALAAQTPGTRYSARCIAKGWGRHPVEQARLATPPDPVAVLTELVAVYDAGRAEPLPLPVKTSYAWAATRVADAAEVRARKQWVSSDRYDGEERSPGVRRAWGADGWGALMAPPRPGEQVPGQQTRMGCYAARVWAPLIDGQDRA